jgi:hypothetical protein
MMPSRGAHRLLESHAISSSRGLTATEQNALRFVVLFGPLPAGTAVAVLVSVWATTRAAHAGTRRYSVVCSGRCRSQ